jgi:uncharacterized GH25 family protein
MDWSIGWQRARARAFALACIAVLACSNAPCSAHQKWLWPNRFLFEAAPVWVSFDVTWSDDPFQANTGVMDRPINVISPAGEKMTPERVFIGKTKSTAECELKQAGTYRLESVDPLTYWSMVMEGGEEKWLKQPKNAVVGREIKRSDLYWTKAIAYVTVGETTALTADREADPLSIVPSVHPNEIVVDSPVEFKVLLYGKPLGEAEMQVFGERSEAHKPEQTATCDSNGVCKLTFKSPGKHLVVCQLERDVADDPRANKHLFTVYLTLQVQAELKKK